MNLVKNVQTTVDYLGYSPDMMTRLYHVTDEFFTEYIYDPAEFMYMIIPNIGAFLRDIWEYYTLMCNYCGQVQCTDTQTLETALSMITPISRLIR